MAKNKAVTDTRYPAEVFVQLFAEKDDDGEHLCSIEADMDVVLDADLDNGPDKAPYTVGERVAVYTFSHFEKIKKTQPRFVRKKTK